MSDPKQARVQLDAVGDKVLDGQRISAEEAVLLLEHEDLTTLGAMGDLVLHVDDTEVARAVIRTQPGKFGLAGGGLVVGRAIAPAPDPGVTAPQPFQGGSVEALVIDLSGEPFVDHEAEVAAYLARD